MAVKPVVGPRVHAPKKVRRDGAPPDGDSTEIRLGPLPGRDQYVPSGSRPAQPPQPAQVPAPPAYQAPTAPEWPNGQPVYQPAPAPQPAPQFAGNGSTFTPLGPGFTNGPTQLAATEPTAREERPLTLAGGIGGIEGKHVALHYNLSDKTAIGATAGSISTEGGGVGSYGIDLRQYVASEKNWGIYVQPGIHGLTTPDGFKPAGSAQLGLEWRTNSGITFNVFGGGAYVKDAGFKPTVGVQIGLSF